MTIRILKKLFLYLALTSIMLVMHAILHTTFRIISPNILFIIVFFLGLTEHHKLSSAFLVMIGLLNDYLEGNLIGITSLQLCILEFLMKQNKKAVEGQKFGIIWAAFTILILILYVFKIIVLMIYDGNFFFNVKVLLEICLTISFYPPFHLILSKMITIKVLNYAR